MFTCKPDYLQAARHDTDKIRKVTISQWAACFQKEEIFKRINQYTRISASYSRSTRFEFWPGDRIS
jgi:poly(A) polymerase Pap1